MVSPLPTPRLGLGPQASPSQLEEESGVPGIEGLTPGRVEPGLPESQGRPGRGRREHLLSWASPSCGCKAWADRGPGACPLRSPARCPRPWEMRQAPEGGESPPWLSPSLTGVRAHSSSWGLQDADARRGPWRWGQAGLVRVSTQQGPASGSQGRGEDTLAGECDESGAGHLPHGEALLVPFSK